MTLNSIKKHIRSAVTFNPLIWIRSMRRVAAMVETYQRGAPAREVATDHKSFAILVTPWLNTLVPWYSIMVGVLLAARGTAVVFIFDDLPFGRAPYRSAFIRCCIRRVLRCLDGSHRVLVLTDFVQGAGTFEPGTSLIKQMATLNAVHALRGEMMSEGRAAYVALVEQQLLIADPAIQRLLSQHSFETIFFPGGIFGTSGLWMDRAARAGSRVSSFDAGGYGTVLLATEGVAAQLQDVPRAFARLKAELASAQEDALIVRIARAELEKRHQGNDAFNSQLVATSSGPLDKYRGAVLVALNSSWDQAALGLHTVFGTNSNWIFETVRWIVEHTDATIVVRQHPSERLPVASTTDNYGAFLKEHFGSHARVLFIGAADPVNTYELLSVVASVVVYTSTIGVEAAALGKPVIVPSRSYYAGLGFTWRATSRDEYFDLIGRSLRAELALTAEMRADAIYCYYVTQVCNWVFSPFSPESFWLWSRESVTGLLADSTVQVLLSALEQNIPAATLNHRNNLAAEALQGRAI